MWRSLKWASFSPRNPLNGCCQPCLISFPVFQEKSSPNCFPVAIWASVWGPFGELSQWFFSSGCGYTLKWVVVKVRASAASDGHKDRMSRLDKALGCLQLCQTDFEGHLELVWCIHFWEEHKIAEWPFPKIFCLTPTPRPCQTLEYAHKIHIKCKEMMQKDIFSLLLGS